jgi:hypothetical protein
MSAVLTGCTRFIKATAWAKDELLLMLPLMHQQARAGQAA